MIAYVIWLVVTVLTFLIFRIVYRLTFHPLARYPGPLLSKISSWPKPLQAAAGDRHLHQLKEHQKYGPVVRIGPSSLSFASPDALRTIYQASRVQNPLRKSDFYKTIDAPAGAYSTHSEVSRRKHAFRRRVLDHAFSDASMRSAEEFVLQSVDVLCKVLAQDTLKESWSKPYNMTKYSTYFAYDVMGDLVFGRSFDCTTSEAHRYVPRLITDSSQLLYWVSHLPLQFIVRPVLCCKPLMHWFGGEMIRAEYAFVEYANACVTERIAKEEVTMNDKSNVHSRKDMMHYLINARDSETGQPFTRLDLDAECSLLIAAGADTTSTVLAAAFFYLTLPVSEPILRHLQLQLRQKFLDATSIRWSGVKSNTYLRAIVEEALRMAPAVPSELPRMVLQKPGLEIAGNYIPAGTTVGCSAYVLHHDEKAFPDSFSFKPERWIPHEVVDTSQSRTHLVEPSTLQHPEQVAKAREAFCAFSLGSRGCVGKNLAYMELCLVLARVLWKFDIRQARGSEQVSIRSKHHALSKGLAWREDEFQIKDVFIADRNGPLVEFKRA